MTTRFNKLYLVIVVAALALAGCWDSQEVEQIAFASALGIDLLAESGEYLATVQIIKPGQIKAPKAGASGGSGIKEEAVWVAQGKGKTVFLAVRNLTTLSSRPVSFSHCQAIVISRKAASKSIKPLVDYVLRSRDFRHTLHILIAEEKAEDVIKSVSELEPIPAIGLSGILAQQQDVSQVRPVNLRRFLGWLLSDSASAMAPRVAVEESGGQKMARLTGISVFKEDLWVADFIGKESRGLLWITDEMNHGFLTIPYPEGDDVVNLEIIRAGRKLTPQLQQGRPSFLLEISAEARIAVQTSAEELDPRAMTSLQNRMAAAIKNEVAAALNKARANSIDPFEFGEVLRRSYPREWSELQPRWGELFPTAGVTVTVNAVVTQEGLIFKPIMPPK